MRTLQEANRRDIQILQSMLSHRHWEQSKDEAYECLEKYTTLL